MFNPDFRARGPPFSPNFRGGMSPQHRPWNHHNSPRFHQQFVPHFSSTPRMEYRSPNYRSPNYHRSPSPQQYGNMQRHPRPHSDPRSRHLSRNSLGASPTFKSNFGFRHPGDGGNRGGRTQFSRRSNDSSCGVDDVRMYYHPSMTEDPWAELQPILVNRGSFTTT